MRDFASYACAGAVGTALHYTVFLLVTGAFSGAPSTSVAVWASTLGATLGALCAEGLPPLATQLAATAAALAGGFVFNRYWSFA